MEIELSSGNGNLRNTYILLFWTDTVLTTTWRLTIDVRPMGI